MGRWAASSAATVMSLFVIGASDARAQAAETETSTPAVLAMRRPGMHRSRVDAFADTYFFWDFNQPDPQYVYNQNPLHLRCGAGFGSIRLV